MPKKKQLSHGVQLTPELFRQMLRSLSGSSSKELTFIVPDKQSMDSLLALYKDIQKKRRAKVKK